MKTYLNEWDKNACSVLKNRFSESFVDQRSIADVTVEDVKHYEQCHFFAGIGGFSLGLKNTDANVWTGGFPCQDLSIAGKREGLAGSRSSFYFSVQKLIVGCLPGWVVLENVPGLLSSNKGRDFAIVIGGLTGIVPEVPKGGWGNAGFFRGPVYQVAYRVLDAQFFGVPQRRRRVFIVAGFGNGRAAEVLFERESSAGNPSTRREAGKGTADTFTIRSGKDGGGKGYLGAESLAMTLGGQDQYLARTITTREAQSMDSETMNFIVSQAYNIQQNDNGSHKRKDRPECGMYVNKTDTSLTVGTTDKTVVAWEMQHASEAYRESGNVVPTLQARMGTGGNQVPMVGVRRLTPLECERLQGFPDGWTEGQSDAQRYKQLGNAVAVPVIEWIGKRIMELSK